MSDLTSVLKKYQKKPISYYLKSTWYFEKFYEKIILIVLGILGLWKIVEWIFPK